MWTITEVQPNAKFCNEQGNGEVVGKLKQYFECVKKDEKSAEM